MPALEAMACGAAVLVSNRASLPEVVGDAGKLVEPRPDALRAAMSALLEDEPALESLRRRGLERAGRYAPAAIGERLFAFLRGVR